MDKTLFEIARATGTPLDIDSSTRNRTFGHYARILVDMDLSHRNFHKVVVKMKGVTFHLEVSYEWMLDYCSHCQIIGHHASTCRWLHSQNNIKVDKGEK